MTDCNCPNGTIPPIFPRRDGSPFVAQNAVTIEGVVENIGFYPNISISDFRCVRMIDDGYPAEQVANALVSAVISVNEDLATWLCQSGCDYDTLDGVPACKIGGESLKVSAYRTAVYAKACVVLYRRLWSPADSTARQQSQEQIGEQIANLEAERFNALQLITGQRKNNVAVL